MLSQADVGKYFDLCRAYDDPLLAIEEVLSAYIVWKLIRGSDPSRALLKLKYLTQYLRATDRTWVLEEGNLVFRMIALELEMGGGRLGVGLVSTPIGLVVWNALRRAAVRYRLKTDYIYGGPGPVDSFMPNNTSSSSIAISRSSSAPQQANSSERPRWVERWFETRPRLRDGIIPRLRMTDYARGAPEYTSQRRTTLPAYVSRDEGAGPTLVIVSELRSYVQQ